MSDLHHRLPRLRTALADTGLDGFVLPRADEFLGEYVPACSERLAWLTGFTGSAGLAVVLRDRAAVFSDGRYITQLEQQLDPSLWEALHMTRTPPADWIAEHAKGGRIGYDPRLMSAASLAPFEARGIELVAVKANPVDPLWNDRPAAPHGPALRHPLDHAGEASADKRARIAQALRAAGDDGAILGDPASVAWLLNIRGTDVPYTPLLLAFAAIDADAGVDLFVDPGRLDAETNAWLGDVRLHAPEDLPNWLSRQTGRTVRVDPSATSVWFAQRLEAHGARVRHDSDPCLLPKARKNAVEIDGARSAHRKDAVAVCRFLAWVSRHGRGVGEAALADRLDAFRRDEPTYRGESFAAISGTGPNGAIIHYRARAGRDRVMAADEIYLIDSGGQYPEGTTDITRSIWTGPGVPPEGLREVYTRVLKGNLALGAATFPTGTTGHRLDTLARHSLWEAGLDYDHGTGHGIGSYLSVHEGPCNISASPRPVPLEPGMIISNEPGFYRPGAFGMRLETLLLVTPSDAGQDGRSFLRFETLTHVPWDRALIDVTLLTQNECHALNIYHAAVAELVLPFLNDEEKQWIMDACSPLSAG
ncbi:Xaa-Pro aminopeptidase [Ameyamaea chiangmaiensis NBRC 103196]|uniref:Aminopeptidase P family protein n=1 Tax=Ameyamaea chiangmaiensis TaxID=442969 RepID=A0A850PDF1_9PROT|nr:aminopeptidase P family protein [Ameyamaea chiangmaiensis]MBS4073783.1 aminopeptidase P family protein [Ameyamaea chiangmaiensis]NVN40510.1 aminopeptidase P family protein [Ameyamaea chiangmaiensis]GBQ68467.1 Xaa-Pro aminopeptidase [Ameyamaea chiangmaiensis NBRC 103196]